LSDGDVAVIQAVYAAWNDGDIDRMLESIDPEIEWRPGTDSPFAGLHKGIDDYERYVRSWASTFEHVEIELGEIRPVGDRLMAEQLQRSRMRGSTVDLEAVVTHVWRVRDGFIAEWFSFRDEREARAFLERHA